MFKKGTRSKYRNEFSGDYQFDYKNPSLLTRFLSEAGKITPARISKLSLNQQRKLAAAIKKSRNLSLIPIGTHSYDTFQRAELVSPVPFEY